MSRSSIVMLNGTEGQLNVTGDPVRADAFFGLTDGLHTVAIYLQNFIGRIFIEGTLSNDPENNEDEWFPINLNGDQPFLQFDREDGVPIEAPTGVSDQHMGKSGVLAFTFQGNFLYLRARVDRSHIRPQPGTTTVSDFVFSAPGLVNVPLNEFEIAQFGVVKKVLLNH